jgi:hypothetical protein
MAYVFVDTQLGMPPVTSHLTAVTSSVGAQVPGALLGRVAQAVDTTYGNGEFIFLKGVASTELGSWVLYNPDDFSTSLLAANDIGSVAVAMAATVANEYGWYQIKGKAVGKVLAGFVDNANVYATATAGSVDDAVVAGDRVKNAKGASAIGTPSAGLAEFEIDHPFMDDALAA